MSGTNKRLVFNSYNEFYPFYLSRHSNAMCRGLHFAGTVGVFGVLGYAIHKKRWKALLLMPVVGYAFAWIGHFVFEKNKPATFKWPLWSFMGDLRMFVELITGKRSFRP